MAESCADFIMSGRAGSRTAGISPRESSVGLVLPFDSISAMRYEPVPIRPRNAPRFSLARRGLLLALTLPLAAAAMPARAQAPSATLAIGVIGAGNIGATLARLWVRAGHRVMLSSRHPEQLRGLAGELGPLASVGTPAESDYSAQSWAVFAATRAQASAAAGGRPGLDTIGVAQLAARLQAAFNNLRPGDITPTARDLGLAGAIRTTDDLPASVTIDGRAHEVTWTNASRNAARPGRTGSASR